MSNDQIKIKIDGKEFEARNGQMLIEVADANGIYIPRFCYHEKLSIVANCRMCLVEVEKAPKPLPACATPVADGMKALTRSPKAIAAQKATMEFLLINHPLDCPICDQGGECELQDLAMGFGSDVSRYTERKRVVKDKNLGPLVSTDMTRCIHCTRCIRFGQEIAGIQELGATGRGEYMEIGTYIENSVDHELSGNIIDICPVGALNSKPFRMHGRGWEMLSTDSISPHDCVGSNLATHVLRGQLMRVVPRQNESVNETWISDRDRFAYSGLYTEDRLKKPMVREGNKWREVDWDTAISTAAQKLNDVAIGKPERIGVLASPSSTVEEFFLLKKIASGLGTVNIDHRLNQCDFRDDDEAPLFPGLGMPFADLEQQNAILVIGSATRKEVPIFAHKLRKAALAGCEVSLLNPYHSELFFDVHVDHAVPAQSLINTAAGILKSVLEVAQKSAPKTLELTLAKAETSDSSKRIAESLVKADRSAVILGVLAESLPDYANLRAISTAIADAVGAVPGCLTHGSNSAGGWLTGAVPHRDAGGGTTENSGMTAGEMFTKPLDVYLLLNLEAELDAWNGKQAVSALRSANSTIVLTTFVTDAMKDYADVLLPIGGFGETAGSFINLEGKVQSFTGASEPFAESRPAWKVLRVIGNALDLDGFDFLSQEEVLQAALDAIGEFKTERPKIPVRDISVNGKDNSNGMYRMSGFGLYSGDMLVRRALPLQATRDASDARKVSLSREDADRIGVRDNDKVLLKSGGVSVKFSVRVDDNQVTGNVWVTSGYDEGTNFDGRFGEVQVERV
ncbi:MAG: NADH-quinone oxidoreductase subunit NuoG [Gammaproteobacteria bacterium]